MNPKEFSDWIPLHFRFADNSELTCNVQLLDSVIKDLDIESDRPDFRVKCPMEELYKPSALRFTNNTFPYLSSWFRYAQILTIEKHTKYPTAPHTELLRTVIFELLRIAEYLFCMATFSLNIGFNKVLTELLLHYESIQKFFGLTFKNIAPDEFISGTRGLSELPNGFVEQVMMISKRMDLSFQKLFPTLLNNRIVRSRCHRIDRRLINQSEHLSSGPNRRASGSDYDCRYDFPYSSYEWLFFDRVRVPNLEKRTGSGWQRLKVRCNEIFLSINLIRQAVDRLVYQTDSPAVRIVSSVLAKGHSRIIIETPWSALTCQMNCPGGREPCEFTLTNPLHEIRLFLRRTSIGLDLNDLPVLIATLGLRSNMEPL